MVRGNNNNTTDAGHAASASPLAEYQPSHLAPEWINEQPTAHLDPGPSRNINHASSAIKPPRPLDTRFIEADSMPCSSLSVSQVNNNIPLQEMSRQRATQKGLPSDNEGTPKSLQQQLPPQNDRQVGSSSGNVSRRNSDATKPIDDISGASRKGKKKEEDGKDGWLSQNFARFGSLNLENKGSVARDHLALERTFLAWLRTSLSFASIGIAVTQLFRLNAAIGGSDPAVDKRATTLRQMGKPLGATFLGIAILVLLIGLNRYYESQNWLLKGKFPASRGSILFLAVIATALILCSLIIVIAVNPSVAK